MMILIMSGRGCTGNVAATLSNWYRRMWHGWWGSNCETTVGMRMLACVTADVCMTDGSGRSSSSGHCLALVHDAFAEQLAMNKKWLVWILDADILASMVQRLTGFGDRWLSRRSCQEFVETLVDWLPGLLFEKNLKFCAWNGCCCWAKASVACCYAQQTPCICIVLIRRSNRVFVCQPLMTLLDWCIGYALFFDGLHETA